MEGMAEWSIGGCLETAKLITALGFGIPPPKTNPTPHGLCGLCFHRGNTGRADYIPL